MKQKAIDRAQTGADPWRQRVTRADSMLALEPLAIDHADAFLAQYRDPNIALMMQLPPLETIGDVRCWIDRALRTRTRHRYAVVHPDYGFVGYVSVRVSASIAHFGFWTGVDYQRRGFGMAAGTLLCEFANGQGIDRIYACAFDDNLRSIGALKRIGFVRMGLTMSCGEDRRILLCRSAFDIAANEATYIESMRQEEMEVCLIDAEGNRIPMARTGSGTAHG